MKYSHMGGLLLIFFNLWKHVEAKLDGSAVYHLQEVAKQWIQILEILDCSLLNC